MQGRKGARPLTAEARGKGNAPRTHKLSPQAHLHRQTAATSVWLQTLALLLVGRVTKTQLLELKISVSSSVKKGPTFLRHSELPVS